MADAHSALAQDAGEAQSSQARPCRGRPPSILCRHAIVGAGWGARRPNRELFMERPTGST